MGRTSQRKGRRGEIELSEKLSAYGYSVAPGAALSFGGAPDITGLPGIHVEAKRRECPDVLAALKQAETDAERFGDGLPVVFWRKNRGTWVALLSLEAFMELYGASKLAGNRTGKGGGCLARDG